MSTAADDLGGSWVPEDTFAVRLIQLRKAKSWTQAQAAEACGVDDGSWSNWENGVRPRGQDALVERIHQATGISRNWLMWGYPNTEWSSDSAGLDAVPDPAAPLQMALFESDPLPGVLGIVGRMFGRRKTDAGFA